MRRKYKNKSRIRTHVSNKTTLAGCLEMMRPTSKVFFVGFLLMLFAPAEIASAHNCVGETHYSASGRIQTVLTQVLREKTGLNAVDLRGVEVRLSRIKDSRRPVGDPERSASGPKARTDATGNFSVHGCFARDSNGILPGGDNIELAIEVRYKSDELQIRRPDGVNWWVIDSWMDRGGTNRARGTIVIPETNFNLLPQGFERLFVINTHANIWWVFDRELRNFRDHGITFTNRVTVTYPHDSLVVTDGSSYAITRIYLNVDDGPQFAGGPGTMLHELIHIWHVKNLSGNTNPNCLIGANHQAPSNLLSNRCTGFMEGISEAISERLMHRRYGRRPDSAIKPVSRAALAAGSSNRFPSFPITSLSDLERTDDGWEQFFRLLFTRNEWASDIAIVPLDCGIADIGIYKLMNALEAVHYNLSSPRVLDILQILVQQVDGFEERDMNIYAALADPTNVPQAVMDTFCPRTGLRQLQSR